MPNYRVTLPNGKAVVIRDAPDPNTAQREAQGWYERNSGARDPWKQLLGGVGDTVGPTLDALKRATLLNPGDLLNDVANQADYLAYPLGVALGMTPPKYTTARNGQRRLVMPPPPVPSFLQPGPVTNAMRDLGPPQPQGATARLARRVGQFLPGIALGNPEVGILPNAFRTVVAPALASDAASEAVRAAGGNQTAQDVAGVLGGVGGGLATGLRVTAPTLAKEPLPDTLSLTEAKGLTKFARKVPIDVQEAQQQAANMRGAGIDPTLIDVTGDPGQGMVRALTSRMIPARNLVQQFYDARAANLGGRLQNQAENVRPQGAITTPDVPGMIQATGEAIGPRNGPQMVHEALNNARDQAADQVAAAYKKARQFGPEQAMIPQAQKPIIAANLREALRDYNPKNVQPVTNELADFDDKSTLNARDLFDLRTRFTRLTQSNDPVTASAARAAVRAVDGEVDRVEPMMTGDNGAVQAWRDAIAARRQFGQTFEGNDLIDTLTGRVNRGGGLTYQTAPENASRAILGPSGMSFAGRPNLARDLSRISDILGPDSPAIQGLQREAFERVVDSATSDNGRINPDKLRAALDRVGPEGDVLFPTYHRAAINEIADTLSRPNGLDVGADVLNADPNQFAITMGGLDDAARLNAQHAGVNALRLKAGGRIGNQPGFAQQVSLGNNVGDNLSTLFGRDAAENLRTRFGLERQAYLNAKNAAPRVGSESMLNASDQGAANAENAMELANMAFRAKATGGASIPFEALRLWLKTRGVNDQEADAIARMSVDPTRTDDAMQAIAALKAPRQFTAPQFNYQPWWDTSLVPVSVSVGALPGQLATPAAPAQQ